MDAPDQLSCVVGSGIGGPHELTVSAGSHHLPAVQFYYDGMNIISEWDEGSGERVVAY